MTARLGSLFAGIGGFELAGKQVGFTPALSCEIDAPAHRVVSTHFADVELHEDVTDLHLEPGSVDVLTAGSPCQDFSIAGMRKGLGGSRSGLFEHFVRLIDEAKPRFAVWENVPGALTSNKGEDFANVLSALVGASEPLRLPKHPKGRTSRYAGIAHGPLGGLAWRTLDAQHFGVAQRRQRIFAVLDTKGTFSFRALFPGFGGKLDRSQMVWTPEGDAWAGCLDIDGLDFDTGMGPPDPKRVHLSEILESDVDERYYLSEKACKGILRRASRRGRSLPPVLDYALRQQAGEEVGEPPESIEGPVPYDDVAKCLTGHPGQRYDYDTESFVPVATYRKVKRARNDEDFETWEESEASNTLNLFDQGDVRATDVVVEPVGFAIEPESGQGADLRAREVDHSPALTANWLEKATDRGVRVVETPTFRVRRLTPRECERLQGFPDGWTDIEGAKDSHRYRQLGNAVAVPNAAWVLGQIKELLP